MREDIRYKGGKYRKKTVGYQMVHKWVISVRGRPSNCEHCGKPNKSDGRSCIEWANKSHEYKREWHDWIALCRSCHMKYDKIDRSTIQKKVWENSEYRERMVRVHKAIPLPPTFTRKGLPGTMLGKKHSEASKEKNRQAHLGKKLTPEHRKKISESLKITLCAKKSAP